METPVDTENAETSGVSGGADHIETKGQDATRSSSPQDANRDSSPRDESEASSPPGGHSDVAMSPANKRLEALLSGKQPEATGDSPSTDQPGDSGKPAGESAQPDEPDGSQAPLKPGALSQEQEQDFNKAFGEKPEWKTAMGIARKAGPEYEKHMKHALRGIYQRETALAGQVETLKPAAAITERIKRCTGDETGMENSVRLIEGWFEGTDEAEQMLEGLLTDLRARKGKTIVSEDLKQRLAEAQQEFDDALIDEAGFARRKQDLLELEAARAGQKTAETKAQKTQQTEAQRRQETLIKDRTTALNTWEKNIAKRDPDYARIQPLVIDRARRLAEQKIEEANGRWLSPKEMTDISEAAYKEVKAELGRLLPKPKARQPLPNAGGSSTELGEQEPTDPAQAIIWRRERRRT